MKTSNLLKVSVAFILCCCSTASADRGKNESGQRRSHTAQHRRDDDRGSYFHRNGHARLGIPKGHYPPPGECRVWYPDRSAGHQPPPGPCHRLRTEVPPGAWLIRHPDDDPEHVHVVVYDNRRPGTIFVTGEFKIATGVFVRVVVDR
jgi:hypothetical protein